MSGEIENPVTAGLTLQEYSIPTGSTGGGYDPYNSADHLQNAKIYVRARVGDTGKWSAFDYRTFARKSAKFAR